MLAHSHYSDTRYGTWSDGDECGLRLIVSAERAPEYAHGMAGQDWESAMCFRNTVRTQSEQP